MFFTAGVFSVAIGAYTTWTRQLREPLIFGFVLLTVFNCLMSTITENTPKNVFWGYPVIGGIGIGVLLTNLTVITQMSTPQEMVAITTGILTATRSLGATVGLAVNSAIFNSAMSSNVGSRVRSAVLPLGYPPEQLGMLIRAFISGDPVAIQSIPDATPKVLRAAEGAMQSAYAASFRTVWICAAAFSAAGLVGTYSFRSIQVEYMHNYGSPCCLVIKASLLS